MPDYHEAINEIDLNYQFDPRIYDQWFESHGCSLATKEGLLVFTSASTIPIYDTDILVMAGFDQRSSIAITPFNQIISEPTTEELWLSLIGIFESHDSNFAKNHDEIY